MRQPLTVLGVLVPKLITRTRFKRLLIPFSIEIAPIANIGKG
jgi:hypothetical protein